MKSPFAGTDQGDAHVDAAAKACQANVLLTQDTGWHDLAPEQLDELPYEVQRPDELFCVIDTSAPDTARKQALWMTPAARSPARAR